MTRDTQTTVTIFSADEIANNAGELGALLRTCVEDGASIGFVLPFSAGGSEAYWNRTVLPAARAGGLVVMVAHIRGRIAGSVQLDHNTMPNQHRRAEVRKLLVHPQFRRQGIARALMARLEQHASQLGRSLLTLDTRSGDMGPSPSMHLWGTRQRASSRDTVATLSKIVSIQPPSCTRRCD